MAEKPSPEKFSRWDSADYLKTEDIDLYFELCLQEDPGDGSLIRRAQGNRPRSRNEPACARHRPGLQNAVPGLVTDVWHQPIRCAIFCIWTASS